MKTKTCSDHIWCETERITFCINCGTLYHKPVHGKLIEIIEDVGKEEIYE